MDSFAAFGTLYVLAFAFNQGMTYLVPVHHGWLWFPRNPGLVSGIVLGGYGAGALIFDNVLTHLINPNNEPIDDDGFYPKDVDDRFIKTWRILIASWLAITLVGVAMTFPGPIQKSDINKRQISGRVEINTNSYPTQSTDQNEKDRLINLSDTSSEKKGRTQSDDDLLEADRKVIDPVMTLS